MLILTKKMGIVMVLLLMIAIHMSLRGVAATMWSVEEGDTSKWQYTVEGSLIDSENQTNNWDASADISFTIEIIQIEDLSITYNITWVDVSVEENKNNPDAYAPFIDIIHDYQDHEGNIVQYTHLRHVYGLLFILSIPFPMTIPLFMDSDSWAILQDDLAHYYNDTKSFYEGSYIDTLEEVGYENVLGSVTGSSTTTGFRITLEVSYIDPVNNTYSSRSVTTCQYSNEGFLQEYISESTITQNSYCSEMKIYYGIPQQIPGYPSMIYFGMVGLTTLGLIVVIKSRRC